MKKFLVVILLAALLGAGLWRGYGYVLDQPKDLTAAWREVDIPKGLGVRQIASLLGEAGIIDEPWLFVLASRLVSPPASLQAGLYDLSASMSIRQILELLSRGQVTQSVVLIPEGFTMERIIQRLAEAQLCLEEEALALSRNEEFLNSLGVEGDSLEGYLFPDTYRFSKHVGARGILTVMVRRFFEQWQELAPLAQSQKMSQREVMILASIIEKEARLDEERPIISAVYHNRLKAGMPLQADPTVIYGLEGFDGRLTRAHLRQEHSYNTYLNYGLPPGPICSPGLASLKGALRPAQVDYLYFVARGDGGHAFARDYRDQVNNIQRYQKKN